VDAFAQALADPIRCEILVMLLASAHRRDR
jgi:hypothetical protein